MGRLLITVPLVPGKTTEIKAEGLPGGRCKIASTPYVKAIEGKVISDTPTLEANMDTGTCGIQINQ